MASATLAPAAKYPHFLNVIALRPDNRIRAMRQRAGLTLEQLGERTGFRLKQLHRFENEQGAPGLKTSGMSAIAKALGCTVVDLLNDEDVHWWQRPKTAEEAAIVTIVRNADDRQLDAMSAILNLPQNDN